MDPFDYSNSSLPPLRDIQPTGWIQDVIEQYQQTGTVDEDGLWRLLGEPTDGTTLSQPAAQILAEIEKK